MNKSHKQVGFAISASVLFWAVCVVLGACLSGDWAGAAWFFGGAVVGAWVLILCVAGLMCFWDVN